MIAVPVRGEDGVVHLVHKIVNDHGRAFPPDVDPEYINLYCELDDRGKFLGAEVCGDYCLIPGLKTVDEDATCLSCVTRWVQQQHRREE